MKVDCLHSVRVWCADGVEAVDWPLTFTGRVAVTTGRGWPDASNLYDKSLHADNFSGREGRGLSPASVPLVKDSSAPPAG
ncbi:hypothetical protein E2C01_001436 [Portunus trituberculatus]|uniref:Uncharacterized protein n=1 Tax=Portunus trituberculatus TaxID=210409 RepID=A0A5B7CGN4_PORTR|nr:hypothetical protein [Portunus trituberculatus]